MILDKVMQRDIFGKESTVFLYFGHNSVQNDGTFRRHGEEFLFIFSYF
jgi:hypothetical protein